MPTILYRDKDGKRLPSVTTINKIGQDSGGLIHWAWDLGIQGIDYRKARDDAAEAGTVGHALVDAALHNKELDLAKFSDETRALAANAFAAYSEWRQQTKLKFIASEVPLVSERWKFGGCLDAVAEQNKKYVLCDWKTGALYPEANKCQLAAYAELWNEHEPLRKITGYHCCRFNKNNGDFVHAYYRNLTQGWIAFRYKLRTYQELANLKADKEGTFDDD
jgi:hypothetical protein